MIGVFTCASLPLSFSSTSSLPPPPLLSHQRDSTFHSPDFSTYGLLPPEVPAELVQHDPTTTSCSGCATRDATMSSSSQPNYMMKRRDDFRKQKELEEARKAGTAPPEVDEDGKAINPHIPHYVSSAPWYLQTDRPTLKHQRNWQTKPPESKDWYERGSRALVPEGRVGGAKAKTYRKGACENCGALTHRTKECTERPRARKATARWSGKNIARDEKVQSFNLSYDGKRDRWNGYDAREFAHVQQRYDKIEAIKQDEAKRKELEATFAKDADGGAGGADPAAEGARALEDEALLDDGEDGGFGRVEKRVRTTAGGATGSVRNLRIREDTAKYLLNLDLASAHYDPKSRSMRADPNPHKQDATFRGDAVLLRQDGGMMERQATDPGTFKGTEAELLFQEFKAKRQRVQDRAQTSIEAKYGNAAAAPGGTGGVGGNGGTGPVGVAGAGAGGGAMDPRLMLGQTEAYVEYDRTGRIVKGQEQRRVCSKYEEDVYPGNHSSVWGSWWHQGKWGYKCCRSTIKNAYCVGTHADGGGGPS